MNSHPSSYASAYNLLSNGQFPSPVKSLPRNDLVHSIARLCSTPNQNMYIIWVYQARNVDPSLRFRGLGQSTPRHWPRDGSGLLRGSRIGLIRARRFHPRYHRGLEWQQVIGSGIHTRRPLGEIWNYMTYALRGKDAFKRLMDKNGYTVSELERNV